MSIPKTSAGSGNIYLGSNLIAEGGCGGWQPGPNTLAYYPLEQDILDYSGNNRNGSGNPNSFVSTGYGLNVASYSGNSSTLPTMLSQQIPLTVLVWINDNGVGVGEHNLAPMGQHTLSGYGLCLRYGQYDSQDRIYTYGWNFSQDNGQSPLTIVNRTSSAMNGWHLMGMTRNGQLVKLYIDGQYISQVNDTSAISTKTFYLGYDHGWDGGAWNGKLSKLIFESIERTSQEFSKYYNQTKSNYGY